MTDLLEALVLPNSSQESFHSLVEYPSMDNSAPHDSAPPPPPQSKPGLSALEASGLPIHDVDAYLAAPENAALLHRAPDRKNAHMKQPTPDLGPAQPVPLGSKSSHQVTALNLLCQQKGLVPSYQIDGDASAADFGGLLKIGDLTFTSDERWHTKKEAREALAVMALEHVKGMEGTKRGPGSPDENNKNWIGILAEYHQSINPQQGPVYEDYSVGLSFSSTCTIPSRPDQPFGSPSDAFSAKKAARANAARLAVEHLIEIGELTPNGSPTNPRKKPKLGAAVRMQGKGLEVKSGSTYGQKVNDAYGILGLKTPQYVLAAASASAPSIFSGHASFPNEPELPKEIGEVRNVFGKKNAKEAIAKGVWEVLRKLAEKRGVAISEIDGGADDYE